MNKKSFLLPILFGFITIFLVASCDKDFNELGTDIVGDDHYDFDKYTDASIKAYNQSVGPIASNNLPINPLGFYTNPAFGTTQANFVTQVEMASTAPTFNNTDPTLYQDLPIVDSVIMEIPYFKTLVKTERIDNQTLNTYVLDSIYGPNSLTGIAESKFKLSVFQSNYYLRNLDPSQGLGEAQSFFTDQDNMFDSNIVAGQAALNNAADTRENTQFFFDKREHKTITLNDDGEEVPARSVPSMRLHLDKTVFNNRILNAPDGMLDNNDVFKNYFRGLYFKCENGAGGNMAMINFKAGKITIYYREDKKKTVNNVVSFDKVEKTFVLNLTGNTVSLLNNTAENPNYISAISDPTEASRLYLKGGQGAISIIDLFGSVDNYRYVLRKNSDGLAIDEEDRVIPFDSNGDPRVGYFYSYNQVNSPNGVPDELDDLRYPALEGYTVHSTKNRWMVNDASLTFNIDTDAMSNDSSFEPGRIYLYDLTHKKVLIDYTFDGTTSNLFPKFNRSIFGGILLDANGKITKQREDDTGIYKFKGSKYKVKITNYVRNLIKNDSTNVRLGLAVTENIGNVAFSKLKIPNSVINAAPTMSVMSPLGTILYGTNPSVPADKKLKLEIYYTKPKY